MGILYIVIILIILAIAIVVTKEQDTPYYGSGTSSRAEPTAPSAPSAPSAAVSAVRAPSASPAAGAAATEQQSMDEAYAGTCGKWVCMYCETLNDCVDGVMPVRSRSEVKKPAAENTESSGASSLLRGDLIRKASANRQKETAPEPKNTGSARCVACGKHQ